MTPTPTPIAGRAPSPRSRLLARRAAMLGGALLLVGAPSLVVAQQLGEGMKRTGTVGIANDAEHKLFHSLICTCGCPRETLGTCTCDFAHARRDELRLLLEEGKGVEEIQALYAQRYGQNALAVPPNVGATRLLWAAPLLAIVVGAGGVVMMLRRWRKRGKRPPGGPGSGAGTGTTNGSDGGSDGGSGPAARDALDDRLDRELEDLDRR